MKRIFFILALSVAMPIHAAAPKRGKEALRELAVFPTITLTAKFSFSFFHTSVSDFEDERSAAEKIKDLRKVLKDQPQNGRRQLQFGTVLDEAGATNEARVWIEKAVSTFRRTAEARPEDGLALSNLGEALAAAGNDKEAETILRRATVISSNEWKCWAALGEHFGKRSAALLTPDGFLAREPDPSGLVRAKPSEKRPPASDLEDSQRLLREASPCFQRGVELAPKEADAFVKRGCFLCASNMANGLMQFYKGYDSVLPSSFLSRAAALDFERAAQLSPNASTLIATAAWFNWACTTFKQQGMPSSEDMQFANLPESVQQSINSSIARLEDLGHQPDKEAAARALENLALLRFMIHRQPLAAAADARRATSLCPNRDRSWEVYFGMLVLGEASLNELKDVCQARLKSYDTARNRLVLAKTLSKQQKWDDTARETRVALRMEPESIPGHLMILAVAIRQNADRERLRQLTERVTAVIAKPSNERDDDQLTKWKLEFVLDGVIVSALCDENARARTLIENYLQKYPADERALAIRSALE